MEKPRTPAATFAQIPPPAKKTRNRLPIQSNRNTQALAPAVRDLADLLAEIAAREILRADGSGNFSK